MLYFNAEHVLKCILTVNQVTEGAIFQCTHSKLDLAWKSISFGFNQIPFAPSTMV